jgi:hypothetical protein
MTRILNWLGWYEWGLGYHHGDLRSPYLFPGRSWIKTYWLRVKP